MNKCLILLTNISPDVVGESFVSNELEFHSKVFNKVIVIPIQNSPHENKVKSYPDNVDVLLPPKGSSKNAKLKDLCLGLFNVFKFNDAISSDKNRIDKSTSRLIFANYIEARNRSCISFCEKSLSSYDFTQFDEVIIYSYWFFLPCRVGVDLAEKISSKGVKVSCITRAHGYDLYDYRNKLNYLPLRDFLANNVKYIYPCSKDGELHLKAQLPAYQDKIKHYYLGTYDRGVNVNDSVFHIVTCSHTVDVKRLDRLIDALAELNGMNLDIRWTHIGDGSLQGKIKRLACQKLGFMKWNFLGRLDNDEVLDFYRSNPVSLFINVSESEGLPVSIMEATSFGIPVLATDVGGTSEIVCDGFNGKLIPKEYSNKEFIDSILYFYNMSDEDYQTVRKNARSYWEENFNAERNYKSFSEMIFDLK